MGCANRSLTILHLEDHPDEAALIRLRLQHDGFHVGVNVVENREQFVRAVEGGGFDLVLADSSVNGFESLEALRLLRTHNRRQPFVVVSALGGGDAQRRTLLAGGADACISKGELFRLAPAIQRLLAETVLEPPSRSDLLVAAVQELSMARSLDAVMAIVRRAARELTGADGAALVLRDGPNCYYADENAIGPLWKGRRFPLETCISGWAMLNRQPAVIADIYKDPRIPHDAYRPTFVKSLAMVPIRTADPFGAIGNYWAAERQPTAEEVRLLQSLADSTSVAMENVRILAELEARVRDRTAELEAANRELEAFSSAVSHDLRGPLFTIGGLVEVILEDEAERLSEEGVGLVRRIGGASKRLTQMVDDLLRLSRETRTPVVRSRVDLGAMAASIVETLRASAPDREVAVRIADGLTAECDAGLMRVVLENLLGNAWKFTSRRARARMTLGIDNDGGRREFFVRDNGAGFDMSHAGRLFGVFQRLHSQTEFPGNGIGLSTVQRIVQKHGGRIRAESAVDKGATFYFTLG